MVKYSQINCRQKPTNCLSVFYHFLGLALKGLILHIRNLSLIFFSRHAGNMVNPLIFKMCMTILWTPGVAELKDNMFISGQKAPPCVTDTLSELVIAITFFHNMQQWDSGE